MMLAGRFVIRPARRARTWRAPRLPRPVLRGLLTSGARKPPVRAPRDTSPTPPDGTPPAPPAAPAAPPVQDALGTIDRAIAMEAMRFYPAILSWARRCGVPDGDTHDVAIEAVLRAVRSWTTWKPRDEQHPAAARRAWLFVITYRLAAAWRKSAARVEPHDPAALDATTDVVELSPEEAALAREAQSERAAEVKLDALRPQTSPENWRAFVAHEVEGVPVSTIAVLEGAPVSTIYNRLRFARRDLRAAILRLRARVAFTTTAKGRRGKR